MVSDPPLSAAGQPNELSPTELAARAGISPEEVARLVDFGILVPRGEGRPYRAADVLKVRVARVRGGRPADGGHGRGHPGGSPLVRVRRELALRAGELPQPSDPSRACRGGRPPLRVPAGPGG